MLLKDHLHEADPAVAQIVLAIAEKAQQAKRLFYTISGKAGSKNSYGQEQDKIDLAFDKLFLDTLKQLEVVKCIVSEEQEKIVETGRAKGLGIAIDPLDGSSCVETNLSVGPIVGIFKDGIFTGEQTKIIAAFYVLYGPLTILVYSIGKGTHEFVLQENNTWQLRKENIKIPEGNIYVPSGNRTKYVSDHEKLIQKMEKDGGKVRCIGSMVGDINNIITHGGFYCYPKLQDAPDGKIRLLFECLPMAFIIENAGGYASNGQKRLLDVVPTKIHQRCPVYIGSHDLVKSINVR